MLAILIVSVSLTLLTLLAGLLVPFLTQLATTELAPGWLQVAVLTLLAALGGALATVISQGGTFPLTTTLLTMLVTWVVAFAAHYGFTVSGLLPTIARLTRRFGFGPRPSKSGAAGVSAGSTA